MTMKSGLYEEVISETLRAQLEKLQEFSHETKKIDPEEAFIILSKYTGQVIRRALRAVREGKHEESETLALQVMLCNQVIELLSKVTQLDDLLTYKISEQHEMLLSLYTKMNAIGALGKEKAALRPETPISESSLFTGASIEPNMVSEIKKEILTSDRIDILMSFIRFSGLVLILDELREFVSQHPERKVRFITTSYMGATEYKALQALKEIPQIEVKMSFNSDQTRLHAKAYLFERQTGFSTAYIGSSNLSRAAMTNGLEWNVKLSERDSFDIIRKFQATFESYWNDPEFESIELKDPDSSRRVLASLMQNQQNPQHRELLFDITPHPFQKEMLAHLEAEREVHGRYKNLLIAATGTGKTVVSAFDYARFARKNTGKKTRLLFVAHRKEILDQSLRTFRVILRDQNFGETFYGGQIPLQMDHLFMSIQTFNAKAFNQMTTPELYDFIIVDEFHHAAAASYQKLLAHYKPQILLGLTATPERMDGKDVFKYFDHFVASELRLPEAIDRQLLSPFLYFGVSDTVDYSKMNWSGRYDENELTKVYTANDHRASLVLEKVEQYLSDLSNVKAIGFCASQAHARHMNAYFQKHGLKSEVVIADTESMIREGAQKRLSQGETNFIFTVDLYNEGVDIPELNTVLFLRPTESLTVFLQQLGRGLRLSPGKEHLTVLDFIGQAHKNYRFEEKYQAIFEKNRNSLTHQIDHNVFRLPRGCYLQFEKMAKAYVIRGLKQVTVNHRFLQEKVRTFEADTGQKLTLASFLEFHKLTIFEFYGNNNNGRSLVTLSEPEGFEVSEAYLNVLKRFKNLFHLNSRRFLNYIINYIEGKWWGRGPSANVLEERLEGMLYYTFYPKAPGHFGYGSYQEGLAAVFAEPFVMYEVKEICMYLNEKIDFVDEPVDLGFTCPLDLHCKYSRDQLMAGLGEFDAAKSPEFREGVKYLKDQRLDLFLINLNKSEKDFSPSTMYEDYAINSTLFHWQSQSTTSEESPTGQRYIHHRTQGHRILLFVREYKKENGLAAPFVYLGKANYIRHEGSKPISFVWALEKEMPANLVVRANKSVM
jgi:superfamily II DNA or RNA helicase